MKIIYSMPAILLCGGAVHHFSVIRRLVERGHEIEVFAPLVKDLDLLPSLPKSVPLRTHPRVQSNLYTLPSETRPLEFFRAFWDLTYGLRSMASDFPSDADAVLATFYPNAFAADLYRRRSGSQRAVLLAVHDDPRVFLPISYRSRYSWIWAGAPRCADRLLTISKALESRLIERYKKPVTIVGNGIDDALLAAPPGREKRASEILDTGGRPYLLYVGSMNYHKGIDVLVEAFAEVRKKQADLLLALVGHCPHPAFLKDLQQRFRVEEHVRHVPGVDRTTLRHLYDSAACFAFPSRTEGFGLPPLEAMARGRPVVCTPCPGVLEYALDGENCLFVAPDRADRLAEAVRRVLEDADLAARLGQAGRIVAKDFTWDRVAARTEQAVESCLDLSA